VLSITTQHETSSCRVSDKNQFHPPLGALCYFLVLSWTLWCMNPKNIGFQCQGSWTLRITLLYPRIMLWNIVVWLILIIGEVGLKVELYFVINWSIGMEEKNLFKVRFLDSPWKGNFHFTLKWEWYETKFLLSLGRSYETIPKVGER